MCWAQIPAAIEFLSFPYTWPSSAALQADRAGWRAASFVRTRLGNSGRPQMCSGSRPERSRIHSQASKDSRKYLSALPNAIELVSGVPRRKPAKSEPAAPPVKLNVPRGSCCEKTLNCCLRKSAPNETLWRPRFQKLLYVTALFSVRLKEYCASVTEEMPLANVSAGGPQYGAD